jgi:hypothetical protein
MKQSPRESLLAVFDGTGMPIRERSRICEVPHSNALLPHRGLADDTSSNQVFCQRGVEELQGGDDGRNGTAETFATFG